MKIIIEHSTNYLMDSQNKILFVENLNPDSVINKDNAMSTLYPQKCNKIKNSPHFDFFEISQKQSQESIQEIINKYKYVLFGQRSIYIYKSYSLGCAKKERETVKENFEFLLNIKNKFFLIQDMHEKTYGSIDKLTQLLNQNLINIIFVYWNCGQARQIRTQTPDLKHYYLMHHINTEIFRHHDSEQYTGRDIDILFFGSIHPRHYPFRKRLFDLLTSSTDFLKEHNINLHVIEKPENFDPDKCEHGLAKLLNRAKFTVCTASRYNYLLAKYFEASACGSMIIGDMAKDGITDKIFEYCHIDNNMSDDVILEKIKNYISQYNSTEKIKTNALKNQKNVIEEYNLDKYVEKLKNIIHHHQV